jgi:tetratricopeptide (TPR) repeat protein
MGIPGVKQSFALFRFFKGPPAVLEIVLPEEMTTDNLQPPQLPGTSVSRGPKMAIPEQMKKLFQDMKMRIAIEIEGEILRTNATHRQGSTITLMDVDFGKLLGKLEALQKINEEMSRNPAKAKESLEKLPGVKIELHREVHVEFAGTQPRDAAYWIDKGAVAHTYGNPEAAIKYYTKAIKLDPNNPSAHFNAGLSYETMGQYERALSSIDKAIELNPSKGQYFYGRGSVYLMAGDKDRATEDFRRAAELGDENAQAYFDSAPQGRSSD